MTVSSTRIDRKGRFRGRRADEGSLDDIRSLIGPPPWRRDLLIEYLHAIQDAHRCIDGPHMVALAELLGISMTEVYEVATFYHHFDVIKDDQSPPPEVTVRVCDSVTCEMFGAESLAAWDARIREVYPSLRA